jgi:hypothetical protein
VCCAGVCTAYLPIGAACIDLYECGPNAVCNVNSVCEARGTNGVGAPCAHSYQCELGFRCALAAAMPTCQPQADEGAACDPDITFACDRLDNFCDPGTKTCVHNLPQGASCAATGLGCPFWTSCDGLVCQPFADLGAPCDDISTFCSGYLACLSGKCTEPEAPCP